MKFFRKVRQKLLSENKLSKYLIYAVGEIILVVIGILIALAINNYNQKQLLERKEQQYLKGLKEEFRISKMKLAELIQINQNNYNGAREIISIMDAEVTPSESRISNLIYQTFAFDIAFNPNNSLLDEMLSSGSLKDIENRELRKQLTNWYSTLENIYRQEKELGVQREKVIDLLRNENYSLRTITDLTGVHREIGLPVKKEHISNLNLLESTEFENNILTFILTSYATEKNQYQPLMADVDSILTLINKEIDEE